MAANFVNPNGFSPVGTITGAAWNEQGHLYFIPSSDVNQYGIGDAVKSIAGVDTTNGLPCVTKSTGVTTELQRGVIVGVFVVPPVGLASEVGQSLTLENTNIPATKTRNYYVMVVDAPETIFEIQDDGSTATAAAQASKNALFTPTNPTAPQQQSATVLALSTVATTQGFPVKMLGLVQRVNNVYGNTYGRWLVMFNQHELMGNTVGN